MGTVLITGGAGFLGSHLCDIFLGRGWRVIVVDNLITGAIDNISHLMGTENFSFIKYNVTHYLFFEDEIDLILHFACPSSPFDYEQYPIHTMKVDSLGTLNTLGLAKNKSARYVFASTSEVYGSPSIHPQDEGYWGHVNPVGPRSVYDEAKRFSEAMCMAYFRKHDVDVRIARIFNTYGTRMRLDDRRAIPTFISQALQNREITIFGDGSQTRSFCFIDDLTRGIFNLSTREGIGGEVFNLGNPEEKTVLDVARTIIEKVGSHSKITHAGMPEDDPPRRRPDIAKARKWLDFDPVIDLKQGLEKVIPWFKEKLEG